MCGADFINQYCFGLIMSASWSSILKRRDERHLFEVRSAIKGAGRTVGFVVGFSDRLILFNVLDMDTFRLNGYSAIRLEDVKDYRDFNKDKFWLNRAARLFKLSPVRPRGILLSSVREFLASVSKRYTLITLHPERVKPDICYIGSLLTMTEATFTIDDLDFNAEWTGSRRLKFTDITRFDFDSGYEKALAASAPKQRKKR